MPRRNARSRIGQFTSPFHRRARPLTRLANPTRRFERLENRLLLTVSLTLGGTQTIVANTNVDASNDTATQQQNMAIGINPTNPLHVSAVSEKNDPTTGTSLGLYRSSNGGSTWTTTTIDNTVDGLSATATRSDPSLAYDANGVLYVSYIVFDSSTTTSTLIVASSTNDGATFSHVITVDSVSVLGNIVGTKLGTGPDGLGTQAVYVAYTENTFLGNGILVAGSHDGGATFTSGTVVSDSSTHNFTNGDPSVGPSGQLYVSWFDTTDNAVRFDRDLDGLFAAVDSFGADITVVDNSMTRPAPLSGNFSLFSHLVVPAAPNHGISTDPQLDTDRTGSATDGNLYLTFTDLFNMSDNDTDIYLARSTNQGASWTLLPVVHFTATEFMPQVAVDQSSGNVNVMYYSTGSDPTNSIVTTNLAVSTDAGSTYVLNQQLSSTSSTPSAVTGGNDFGDYTGLAVLDGTAQALWADNRGAAADAEAFTASASFSSSTNANVLAVTGTAGNDAITIRRAAANHAFLEVVVNGQIQFDGLIATLDQINVQGLAGSDTLTIDNSNGIVNMSVNYDGGTSALDDDRLAITGNPGTPVFRETYLVGATAGAGTWVLDPDGSRGPGLNTAGNGDELTVTFTNLEPVDSDTPAFLFDVIMSSMANDATVQNGGLLNGVNSLQVLDNNATFETFRFANKANVRIMGSGGADTLTLDFTIPSDALFSMELDGHLAPDVVGQPADDNAADNLKVFRNVAGIIYNLDGEGGNDNFLIGNGDLSQILGSVAVEGDTGTDSIVVDDSGRATPVNYVIGPGAIAIRSSIGPPAVDQTIATYDSTMENVQLNGTQGPNQFDVTPTIYSTFLINGNLPTSAGPGADILVLHIAGTSGRNLTYDPITGNGNWMFAAPYQTINFTSIEQLKFAPIAVYSADGAAQGKPTVKVVDADTGALITSFQAYEPTYRQGVRVAVGDVNGDGIPEIITAPGHGHSANIEVWSIVNASLTTPPTLLESFLAYPASYQGGAMVAVGDVNGDKLNDLVVAPSRGAANIHTYINTLGMGGSVPFDTVHQLDFLAFKKAFIGGASVAVGNVEGDASAEIIVGSGGGMRDTVNIFKGDTSAPTTSVTAPLQTILPFQNNQSGGVTVATANIDADAFMEIVIGAGTGGRSQMATYDLSNLTTPVNTFTLYTGNGSNAPIRVGAITQFDPSGTPVSTIFAAQGPDGKSQEILRTSPGGIPVDFLMETDPEFLDGFYIATSIS